MADKKPSMSRAECEAALKAGQQLAIGANVYRPARAGHQGIDKLPAAPEEERDAPLEAVVIRRADGNLTRAGMEWTIRHGGSVLHNGSIIESVEDLPDEAELVEHDEAARGQLAASLDAQMAALAAQRAKLTQPEQAPVPAPVSETPPAEADEPTDDDEGKGHRRRGHRG